MLPWITKIILEQMALMAMFATSFCIMALLAWLIHCAQIEMCSNSTISCQWAHSTSELCAIALPQLFTFVFSELYLCTQMLDAPPTGQNLTMNQQNGGNLESRALLVQLAPFHFPKKKDYSYMLNASWTALLYITTECSVCRFMVQARKSIWRRKSKLEIFW